MVVLCLVMSWLRAPALHVYGTGIGLVLSTSTPMTGIFDIVFGVCQVSGVVHTIIVLIKLVARFIDSSPIKITTTTTTTNVICKRPHATGLAKVMFMVLFLVLCMTPSKRLSC